MPTIRVGSACFHYFLTALVSLGKTLPATLSDIQIHTQSTVEEQESNFKTPPRTTPQYDMTMWTRNMQNKQLIARHHVSFSDFPSTYSMHLVPMFMVGRLVTYHLFCGTTCLQLACQVTVGCRIHYTQVLSVPDSFCFGSTHAFHTTGNKNSEGTTIMILDHPRQC